MVLEIDNVELSFSTKNILNGIYLKAETGRITGILGSNGSGKSCLLEIIFGSLIPKYKLVRIDTHPILKPLFKTQLIKYLPQSHFLPKQRKVSALFKLYDVNWASFITEFESFSKYKNTKFNILSGGEKRFIEIYLTLKSSSKIIIMDEPFSHLSPFLIELVKTIIHQEKEHKAIIITDHMYRHIINISDTIYLLKNGTSKLINNLYELEDYKYLSTGSLT